MSESVVLLDHRAPMRDALRFYLNRFPTEWQVVAEIDRPDPDFVAKRLLALQPDLLILNRMTAGKRLTLLLQAIRDAIPQVQIVVIGVSYDEAAEVLPLGIDGIVLSGDPPSLLLTQLRSLRYDRESTES
jgi:DNA-binding NarL/FixJ family response regulator